MSDFSTLVKPLIEEPSKASPSVMASSSKAAAGTDRCCSVPGTSVKRTSIQRMPLSVMNRRTPSGVGSDRRVSAWLRGGWLDGTAWSAMGRSLLTVRLVMLLMMLLVMLLAAATGRTGGTCRPVT